MTKLRAWIWPLWLPVALLLYLRASWAQVGAQVGAQVFRSGAHAGAELALLAAGVPVWLALRRRWPRAELWLISAALVVPPLWRHPVAFTVTAAVLAAALGFGRFAMERLNAIPKGRAAQIAIAAGVGFGAWMVVLMALGLSGTLRASAVITVLIAAIALFRRAIAKSVAGIADGLRDWSFPGNWTGVQTMFLFVIILVMQPVVIAPSVLYDALATHLAASRNYSLHHSMAASSEYDFLPQGLELMMSGADTLGGQAAEQMVAPLFLGSMWLAVFAIAREIGAKREAALTGATLAIAVPFVAWNGAVVKNDIMAAFFLLAALLAFLARHPARGIGWIVTASFLCAAAENVKHTAMLGAAPMAIVLFIAAWREPERARAIVLALAVFVIFGGFWFARAGVMRGDILYPLRSPGAMAPMAGAAFHSVAERLNYLGRLQFAGMPIFEGTSSTRLGPIFLLFFPAVLWIRRRDSNERTLACLWFTAAYLSIWILTWPVLRYAAAPVVLVAAAMGVGVVRAAGSGPKWLSAVLLGGIVSCYLCVSVNLAGMTVNVERMKYMARLMDDDSYLRGTLASYAAIAWTREHPIDRKRIVAAGTHSIAYAAEPALMDSMFAEEGPFPAGEIKKAIDTGRYGYAIVPSNFDAEAIFGARKPEFADIHFKVFRLP